jgi:hypothetical protein
LRIFLVGNIYIYRVNNHAVVWRTFLGGNVSRNILNVVHSCRQCKIDCVENVSGRRCIIKSAEFASISVFKIMWDMLLEVYKSLCVISPCRDIYNKNNTTCVIC